MRFHRSMLCLLLLIPISCASDSSDSTPEPRKSLAQRMDENNGYTQDAEGNWQPKTDKRSQFENKGESAYFKGEVGKKDYKTGDLSKKSWWGNKDYGSKPYAGSTNGSRFQKSSGLSGQGSPDTGKSAGMSNGYETGDYGTGNAREDNGKTVRKFDDDRTKRRRNAYPPPEIIDWREQRSLSLEQSKGILGH